MPSKQNGTLTRRTLAANSSGLEAARAMLISLIRARTVNMFAWLEPNRVCCALHDGYRTK